MRDLLICWILIVLSSEGEGNLSRDLDLDIETASNLAQLPLECMYTEYPNKLTYKLLKELHPAFYGCFDWHSSVNGHWLLAKVANLFPESEVFPNISSEFSTQFTQDNIRREMEYFESEPGKSLKIIERTYGWAWLLKLQMALQTSNQEEFVEFADTLKPFADYIADLYVDFLPRLAYPVRVGEHANTAFGLAFALDYARIDGNLKLEEVIRNVSSIFYLNDSACPLSYEPSGYDFLSPCLQEADLMARLIEDPEEYIGWLNRFLPQLFDQEFNLQPGEVIDRTDGKLVHLDGLNFSRAWALFNIADKLADQDMKSRLVSMGDEHILKSIEDMKSRLVSMGDEHILKSIDYVVGSDYAGSHWLASFLFNALEVRNKNNISS